MRPIRIVEVGPRDGLQNEKAIIPTDVKIALVDALSLSGVDEIEVSSFVSPAWIPQLADAEAVFGAITRRPGVQYSALVPNEKGFDRAMSARVDKIAVFTAASETFSQKNTNASIAESLQRFKPILKQSPVPVRGYLSTAWHCPYEGPIDPRQAMRVAQALLDLGCAEISLGDTIGLATPDEVATLLDLVIARHPIEPFAMHFHDTYGRALANASRAAEYGVQTFDGSVGGVGGCPYAPGASGNVSTQALVSLFRDRSKIDLAQLDRGWSIIQSYLEPRRSPADFR